MKTGKWVEYYQMVRYQHNSMAIISGDKFFGGKAGTVVQSASSPLLTPQEPGYIERLKQDFTTRQKDVQEAKTRQVIGEQTGGETFAQTAGQGIGLVTDIALEAPGIKQTMEGVGKGIKWLSETSVVKALGEAGTPLAEKILAHYDQASPREKANIEAALNIASIIPVGKAGELTVKAGMKAVEVVAPVVPKIKSLFKRKAISVDDVANQIDEALKGTPVKRDSINKQLDILIEQGKIAEARALAESSSPGVTFKEKLAGLRPDIKQRIQGKPELMQEYLDVVNTRNVNDTAQSVVEYGGNFSRKAADIMEQKLTGTGSEIGAFRQKVGTYKAPIESVTRIETSFNNQLSKLNLEIKGGVVKQKAGTIARVNSANEIKVLNDLLAELQIIKQSPDLQRLIDFRNLFDSKINFAKSTRDVSSSLDPFSRAMRKEIADVSAQIVGKSEAKNLAKYSDFMDALSDLKSFTDRKAGGEYLLRVLLSGRGGEARKIVQTIKEYTGIDLMDHATMMQVTNEMLGNTAQKNLFRQEMINAGLDVASLLAGDPRGAAMTLFNKATERFINPEKILMEAAKSKP